MKIIVRCGCGGVGYVFYTEEGDGCRDGDGIAFCEHCSKKDETGYNGDFTKSPHWISDRHTRVEQNIAKMYADSNKKQRRR